MADIKFQILNQSNSKPSLETFSGSGLAFYGSTAGSSVQIGSFQDNSYVANADGSSYTEATNNIKYVNDGTHPSGRCSAALTGGSVLTVGLSGIKSFQSTLGIQFSHTSEVKTQNCQLRIYDRSNINYPASGVNTKVAEIINFNGAADSVSQGGTLSSAAVGSGDLFWWGEPWPSQVTNKAYFTNSSGEVFYNADSTASRLNGDARLADPDIAGSYATVGGTGVIVPLANSPGSGQKQLHKNDAAGSEGQIWPKWTQYVTSTANQQLVFDGSTAHNFGDGSATLNKVKTYGGTGIDTHHTWAVALSASPLSIGSKEDYGLYVSLEYL